MLKTVPLSFLSVLSSPSLQPVYAIRMNQGDRLGRVSTIVGITPGWTEAKAYVAKQEEVLASILDKYKALAPALAEWTVQNPLSPPIPGQSYEDYYHVHGKWTVALSEYQRAWLKKTLTLEELNMDATRDNNAWFVEPLRWLSTIGMQTV